MVSQDFLIAVGLFLWGFYTCITFESFVERGKVRKLDLGIETQISAKRHSEKVFGIWCFITISFLILTLLGNNQC